ncbi:HAD family phosphatase [Candidatus Woesearchaeota archaeon]|nr:HAD family phosphatase [Candidatus Woesearchaeota archaeon]
MIKEIIFDLGRVVVHDPDSEIIFQDIADSCKLNYELVVKTATELIPAYQRGDLTDFTFWQEFAEITRSTAPENGNDLWSQVYAQRLMIDNNILNLVDRLKDNGYVTPALSNTIPPHVHVLKYRGVLDHFAPQILSCEVGMRKPEEAIYRLALEKSCLKPEEAVFIDDVPKNVEAAEKIGINGIHYRNFKQLESELKSLGINI